MRFNSYFKLNASYSPHFYFHPTVKIFIGNRIKVSEKKNEIVF